MTYTPTEWKNGDVITAEKLNKIEEGVSGNNSDLFMLVNAETIYNDILTTIDKTFDEITNFIIKGGTVMMRLVNKNPNAPYWAAYYLSLKYSPLDFSPQFGVGRISFENIQYETSASNVTLNMMNVNLDSDGSNTIESIRKTIA